MTIEKRLVGVTPGKLARIVKFKQISLRRVISGLLNKWTSMTLPENSAIDTPAQLNKCSDIAEARGTGDGFFDHPFERGWKSRVWNAA